MSKIEAVRKDVMTWRRAHGGRRGPLPMALRRRAGELVARHGEDEVCQALDLVPETVKGWHQRYGKPNGRRTPRRKGAHQAFVEVGAEVRAALVGAVAVDRPAIKAEVVRPCGTLVRFEGTADTKEVLEALLDIAMRRVP